MGGGDGESDPDRAFGADSGIDGGAIVAGADAEAGGSAAADFIAGAFDGGSALASIFSESTRTLGDSSLSGMVLEGGWLTGTLDLLETLEGSSADFLLEGAESFADERGILTLAESFDDGRPADV